jgi:hypothetical protein
MLCGTNAGFEKRQTKRTVNLSDDAQIKAWCGFHGQNG